MNVTLNHTIVWCRDKFDTSARYLTDTLGLEQARPWGPFMVVELGNGVSLDYHDSDDPEDEIASQHYAFLVSESDFGEIFGCLERPARTTGRIPGSTARVRSTATTGAGVNFKDPTVTSSRSSPGPTDRANKLLEQARWTARSISGWPVPKAPPAGLLDEAFDQVSALDFEIPNPFVNHAPMACEALSALGFDSAINEWVEHYDPRVHRPIQPVTPTWGHEFSWKDMVGDLWLLPEWMGYFERAIDDDGWRDVVQTWVPRLMPGQVSALFHGVIRNLARGAGTRCNRHQIEAGGTGTGSGELGVLVRTGPANRRELRLRRPGDGNRPGGGAGGGLLCVTAERLRSPRGDRRHGRAPALRVPGSVRRGIGPVPTRGRVSRAPPRRHPGPDGRHRRRVGLAVRPQGRRAALIPTRSNWSKLAGRGLDLTGDPHFIAAARVVTDNP